MIHYKLSNVLICVLRFLLASPLYSSAPLFPSPDFEDFPTLLLARLTGKGET